MARELNFNKVKKQYLVVTLADEKNTTLMIGTPTKATMDYLVTLADNFGEVKNEEISSDVMEQLYTACAKIMSHNKGGIQITSEELAELFDFEDILLFYNAYMAFVTEIAQEKN